MCEHDRTERDDEVFRLVVTRKSILMKLGNRDALQDSLAGARITDDEWKVLAGIVQRFVGGPRLDESDDKPEGWRAEFSTRLAAIHTRIQNALGEVDRVVEFSAFDDEEGGLPIDNLDERAVEGKAKFLHSADRHWGDGCNYYSEVVENPTWLQVALIANEAILTTADTHHVFLESIERSGQEGDVKLYNLGMGS